MNISITIPQMVEIIGSLLVNPQLSCNTLKFEPRYIEFIDDLSIAISRISDANVRASTQLPSPYIEFPEPFNVINAPVANVDFSYTEVDQACEVWRHYISLSKNTSSEQVLNANAEAKHRLAQRGDEIQQLIRDGIIGDSHIAIPLFNTRSNAFKDTDRQHIVRYKASGKTMSPISIAPTVLVDAVGRLEPDTGWTVELDCLNNQPRLVVRRSGSSSGLQIYLQPTGVAVYDEQKKDGVSSTMHFDFPPDDKQLVIEREAVLHHYVMNICKHENGIKIGVPAIDEEQYMQTIECNGTERAAVIEYYPSSSCPKQMYII